MPSRQSKSPSQSSKGRGGPSAPPIAIDFGIGQLKVLQISGGGVPSVVAAAALETPEELLNDASARLEFQMRSLPGVIRKGKFRPGRAVASVPMGQLLCKNFQFQKTDMIPIGELASSAAAEQLGCMPQALTQQVIEVEGASRGAKSEVICLSASRDLVDRLLSAMQAAKLTPVGVHPEPIAMVRCFDHLNRRGADSARTTLYLDVGRGSSKLAIAHGQQIVYCRGIEIGGLHFDEEVAHQTGWTVAESGRLRRQMTRLSDSPRFASPPLAGTASTVGAGPVPQDHGERPEAERREYHPAAVPPSEPEQTQVAAQNEALAEVEEDPATEELLADLTEPLEILADEIAMSVRYHDGMFPQRRVDEAVFVGGELTHTALAESIARTLNIPTQMSDPMAQLSRTGSERALGVDLSVAQPGWAVAVGMCMAPTDL